MLGVFRRDVNQPADPLAPEVADSRYIPALRDGYLEKQFVSLYSPCVVVKLGNHGFVAYSTKKDLSPNPRPMFCMRGGIYCICRCSMRMMEQRKKAGDNGNESDLLVACYTDLMIQGKEIPLKAMQKSLDGDYNYILYDSANMEGSVRRAIAVNCWGDTPLYYGLDSEGCCIITDCFNIIAKIYGELKSIKDIPKGHVLQIPIGTKAGPVSDSSSGDNEPEKESADRFYKMLGVFRKDVNQPDDPLAPEVANSRYIPALRDGYLEKQFASLYSPCVIVKLGNYGFMAYSTKKDLSPDPRPMFCIRDGIYCICRCSMEMMKQRKKAGDNGNESGLLVACYTDLIKQGNKIPLEAMQKSLDGDYNYILYDSAKMEGCMRRAIAVNCWGDTPLYYGLDSEGCCIITDCFNIIGKVCGELKSIKDIPKGHVLQIPVSIEP